MEFIYSGVSGRTGLGPRYNILYSIYYIFILISVKGKFYQLLLWSVTQYR